MFDYNSQTKTTAPPPGLLGVESSDEEGDDPLLDREVEARDIDSYSARKKGTLDWRVGSGKSFTTFGEFDNWRKSDNTFNWAQKGHSKQKLYRSDKYEWYKYVCQSHRECTSAVS